MGVDHSTPSDTEKRVQERKDGAVGPQDWERGLILLKDFPDGASGKEYAC